MARVWEEDVAEDEDMTQKVEAQQESTASFAWGIGVAKEESRGMIGAV